MGARGPGARRLIEAREQTKARPLPWTRRGLSRPERVIRFLEFLPITKGPLAGKRMKLLDEQRAFVAAVYGDLDKKGRRRRRIAIKSEPKGNGKTGLLAGIALCHLLGPEAEPRGEIYSAAIDRQQAAIMFNEMEAIILAVPEFARICNPVRFHKKIEVTEGPAGGSIYEALSADARRSHGLAPSLWVYDELAQAKDRVLLDGLIAGLGKRDVSHDDPPVPLAWFRPDGSMAGPEPIADGSHATRLNDQHCHLTLPASSPLQVGDLVAFGISHPCLTFDKWRALYLVDEAYDIVGAIRTYF